MGLDMYLERRHYVGNKYRKPNQQLKIKYPKPVKGKAGFEDSRIKAGQIDEANISSIIEEVGYWRKANAIHGWFVDNVMDGNDDNGGDHYVSREQLTELLELCKKVLKASKIVKGKIKNGYTINAKGEREYNMEDGEYIEDPSVAEELLPAKEGFFFGSYDYDQYYLQDIKDTIEIIEKALKSEDGDFYYNANW